MYCIKNKISDSSHEESGDNEFFSDWTGFWLFLSDFFAQTYHMHYFLRYVYAFIL